MIKSMLYLDKGNKILVIKDKKYPCVSLSMKSLVFLSIIVVACRLKGANRVYCFVIETIAL